MQMTFVVYNYTNIQIYKYTDLSRLWCEFPPIDMQLCSPLDPVTPIEAVQMPLERYYYTEREVCARNNRRGFLIK